MKFQLHLSCSHFFKAQLLFVLAPHQLLAAASDLSQRRVNFKLVDRYGSKNIPWIRIPFWDDFFFICVCIGWIALANSCCVRLNWQAFAASTSGTWFTFRPIGHDWFMMTPMQPAAIMFYLFSCKVHCDLKFNATLALRRTTLAFHSCAEVSNRDAHFIDLARATGAYQVLPRYDFSVSHGCLWAWCSFALFLCASFTHSPDTLTWQQRCCRHAPTTPISAPT